MELIVRIHDKDCGRCLAEVPVDPTTDTLPIFLSKIALDPNLSDDTDNNASDPVRFVKRMWIVPKGTKSDMSPMDPVEVRLPSLRGVGDQPLSRTVFLSEAFALGAGAGPGPADDEITVLIEGCRNNEEAVSLLYASNCQLRSENDELRSLVEDSRSTIYEMRRDQTALESKFEVLKSYVFDIQRQLDNSNKKSLESAGGALPLLAQIRAKIASRSDLNELNKDGMTLLHLAAKEGDMASLEALIDAQANVDALNKDGLTPLHVAVQADNEAASEALIAEKADVNAPSRKVGPTPTNLSELLLMATQDNITPGTTPLHLAAEKGFVNVMRVLIAANANVNAVRSCGATPLYAAAAHGQKAAIETLVADKADVNFADKDGDTPLFVAAGKGHMEAVEALIAAKANVNAANKQGWAPIHVAARGGHTTVVKALAAAGANVNITKSDGWTALHLAASNGQDSTVLALLELKANINVTNRDGHTPLYLAAKENEPVAMLALINGGAEPIKVTPAECRSFEEEVVSLLESSKKIQVARQDPVLGFLAAMFGK